MWLRKILVLNLILLIVLTGCQVGEEIEAIRTVRLYNEKLVLALKKPEPELMKQLTSDKEYERVKMYILNLYQNKAVIDSKLYNIEIVSVKFDGKKSHGQNSRGMDI